jgi:lysophospholipase L1-like esterase
MSNWFDDEVAALERRTKPRFGAERLVLFYGSSTFTLWHDLEEQFPGFDVLNHGFGGSHLTDCLHFFDRLVVPVRPRAIVLYAGDNDLDFGARPEDVRANLKEFMDRKRRALGDIPVAYVSVKVSPARFHIMFKISYTNYILENFVREQPDMAYIDTMRRMTARGRLELLDYYSEDPLHMNPAGYRIWRGALAEHLEGLHRSIGPLRPEPPPVPANDAAAEEAERIAGPRPCAAAQ